jgi:peptidoglycan/LPS O-acetylase OafA/YrhL
LFGGVFRRTAVNFSFTGVLGISLLLGTSRFKWIVQRPVLQWFGEISYGLYLIHMLAFDFVDHWIVRYFPDSYSQLSSRFGLTVVRFLLSMGVAVGVAFLSRRYFEEWFLKWKDRLTAPVANLPPHSAPVLVTGEPAKRTA